MPGSSYLDRSTMHPSRGNLHQGEEKDGRKLGRATPSYLQKLDRWEKNSTRKSLFSTRHVSTCGSCSCGFAECVPVLHPSSLPCLLADFEPHRLATVDWEGRSQMGGGDILCSEWWKGMGIGGFRWV